MVGVHPEARRELGEAADFYERERPGFGAEFLDEAERTLRRIADFPRSSPVVIGSVNWPRAMARFPYTVMYSERDGGVYVAAFAHSSRRPLNGEAASEHTRGSGRHYQPASSSSFIRLRFCLCAALTCATRAAERVAPPRALQQILDPAGQATASSYLRAFFVPMERSTWRS